MSEAEIEKDLSDLKQIYEIPILHITNQLNDIKSEIDLTFFQLQNNQEAKKVWLEIINKVEKYERECCSRANKNVSENINDFNSFLNKNDYNETIQNEKFKIEKSLFLNKTLIFLNKNNCENKSLFDESNEFKFVIVNDEFITKEGIESLLKSSNFQIRERLSNEKIKLKLLKTKLIDMSSQLNETNLLVHTLEELDFYSYKLSSLDSNTFYDFTNLKRLSLRDNNISKIHSTTFQNLINLENLNLDDNQLYLFEEDTFKGLTNLKDLSINSNKLTEIQVSLFKGLENLNSIWCNRNNISELYDFTFKDLRSLMWLSLGYNQIKTIHLNAFCGLTNLKELYIDNNKLKSIKLRIFNPLENLETLCLNKNPVTYSIKIIRFKFGMSRTKVDCKVYTHKNYFL